MTNGAAKRAMCWAEVRGGSMCELTYPCCACSLSEQCQPVLSSRRGSNRSYHSSSSRQDSRSRIRTADCRRKRRLSPRRRESLFGQFIGVHWACVCDRTVPIGRQPSSVALTCIEGDSQIYSRDNLTRQCRDDTWERRRVHHYRSRKHTQLNLLPPLLGPMLWSQPQPSTLPSSSPCSV